MNYYRWILSTISVKSHSDMLSYILYSGGHYIVVGYKCGCPLFSRMHRDYLLLERLVSHQTSKEGWNGHRILNGFMRILPWKLRMFIWFHHRNTYLFLYSQWHLWMVCFCKSDTWILASKPYYAFRKAAAFAVTIVGYDKERRGMVLSSHKQEANHIAIATLLWL